MPGARIFRMVVTRLMPPISVPAPEMSQRPQPVVHPHAGRIGDLRQGRVGQPARALELADHQRDVDQQRARRRQPERHRVERGEGHVAHAQLQRHDVVHQPDHERHRHEEDHDRAVRGEHLVVVFRRQEAVALERQRLLRAHHDGVGEAAQQHHQRQDAVHDADALVVDAGDPLAPQVRHPALERHPADQADRHERDHAGGDHGDGLVEGDGAPVELAEQLHAGRPSRGLGKTSEPGLPTCGPGAGAIFCDTTASYRPGSTAR